MLLKQIGMASLLLMAVNCNAGNNTDVYKYPDLSVSVLLSDSETIKDAVVRAESLLQINAVTMTPKFVSHSTSYDSTDNSYVETGLIAQGANVSVSNTQFTKEVVNGSIQLNVIADVLVDVSTMKEKISSDKREMLLKELAEEFATEYEKLSAVLYKIRSNHALSTLDSLVVTDYYAKMNSTVGSIDGAIIKEQLTAHRNGTNTGSILKSEIVLAYERFVLPFMANPTITYEVIDIIPHIDSVAEFVIRVNIARTGNVESPWFPSDLNSNSLKHCDKFFYGCEELVKASKALKLVEIKDVLTPKYCSQSLFEFLPYAAPGAKYFGNSKAERGIYCGRYNDNLNKYHDWTLIKFRNERVDIDKPAVPARIKAFNEAFQDLSKRSYWLQINVGTERFKVNISNLYVTTFKLSAFIPEQKAIDGLNITFSVQEETFDSEARKWTDMNGNFLRYQSRKTGFY